MPTELDIFEDHRSKLFGMAYRMLGTVSEAEDVLQEAWIRWSETDRSVVENPAAYLATIVNRLSLDQLRSARRKREHYVGVWLPEPMIEDQPPPTQNDPAAELELADDVSFALLVTLEKLTASERAALLLHDVFDYSFAEIAEVLHRNEASCRKLASRARTKVRNEHGAKNAKRPANEPLVRSFHAAMQYGDLSDLVDLLAQNAVLFTDGGGVKSAALNPIYGRDKIHRFFVGILSKNPRPKPEDLHLAHINAAPGIVVTEEDGSKQVWSFDCSQEGEIQTIYIVRNPDKLRHCERLA